MRYAEIWRLTVIDVHSMKSSDRQLAESKQYASETYLGLGRTVLWFKLQHSAVRNDCCGNFTHSQVTLCFPQIALQWTNTTCSTWESYGTPISKSKSVQDLIRYDMILCIYHIPSYPRITWLSTIQQDLKHHHLKLPEAADLAQNRPLWRMMSTYGATQPWVACQKRRRR